ncbi:MAG: hypothetical protein ACFHU9_14365 [Fluviicola sp.]
MTEEKTITESSNGLIKLTNHKIRYVSKSYGKARIISMMLNEVSAIEVHFRSYIPALIMGILFFLGALIVAADNQRNQTPLGLMIVGIIFVIYYFLSRKHVVSIVARGKGSIDFESKGISTNEIIHFVNKVEMAKQEYEKYIHNLKA